MSLARVVRRFSTDGEGGAVVRATANTGADNLNLPDMREREDTDRYNSPKHALQMPGLPAVTQH